MKMEKKFEYLNFARAYFIFAYIGIDLIRKKLKTGEFKNPLGEITPDWVIERNYLLAPIIFNLKHGIEISLKNISQFLGDDFEEKHDLRLLFRKLKPKLDKKYDGIDDLEQLILKYYQNTFLEDKVGDSLTVEDKLNDLFRYPESKVNLSLDFFNIFPKFTDSDLENLQSDIKFLDHHFYQIGSKLLKERYGKSPTVSEISKQADELRGNKNPDR